MKRRKLLAVMALFLTLLLLTACGGPEADYKSAQSLLAKGEYSEAAEKFEALGSYEDATMLAVYCKACALCENGDFENGIAALQSLGEYKDCKMRISYYTARSWDEGSAGTTMYGRMEQAKSIYNENPLYLDSAERIAALDERIAAAKQSRYDYGVTAGDNGDYTAAIDVFERLGDYSDSEMRSNYYLIRSMEEKATETDFEGMELARAEYAKNSSYLDSAERMAALDERIAAAVEMVYASAVDKEKNSDYSGALDLYNRLGDYQDSVTRGAYCSARKMEETMDVTSYENVNACIAAYEPCANYADSSERVSALERQKSTAMLCRITKCYKLDDGVIIIEVDGKQGYIDTTGKVLSEPQWDDAWGFSEGLATVVKDGKWGYIDTTGKVVIEPQWDYAQGFSEGLAGVKKDGKYGYIDTTGKVVSEPQWDDARSFSEGLAKVEKNGKWGYINTTGKVVSEPQWSEAKDFYEGLAKVEKGNKSGLINREGKIVLGFGVEPTFPLQ
ncbi:MAG: WG repeat-containing protein [Clostridiales bacterium]|nr:WG repeat-containing protein [Clostridiales bacterium]